MLNYNERQVIVGDEVTFDHLNLGKIRGKLDDISIEANPWSSPDESIFDVFLKVDGRIYLSFLMKPGTFHNISREESFKNKKG